MHNLLLIRADATKIIGVGHVMRCLALAQAWRGRGGQVVFVSHCDSEGIKKRINEDGFDLVSIESPHPDRADVRLTLEILHSYHEGAGRQVCCWLVTDGPHFDAAFHLSIKDAGYDLMVVDDLNNQTCYNADIVLNQNLNAEIIRYSHRGDARLLLGIKYVMLREEILKYRNWKRKIPDQATKILVTLGGADTDNATWNVISALRWLDCDNVKIKVVIGPVNTRMACYHSAIADLSYDVELLYAVDNMSELIKWADMSIICAGGTLWECLFMRCPIISFAVNAVQHDILQSLNDKDVIMYMGYVKNVEDKKVGESIEGMLYSSRLRTKLSNNGGEMIDGDGVSRIVDAMMGT